jgi:hypothetical protein
MTRRGLVRAAKVCHAGAWVPHCRNGSTSWCGWPT